MFTMYFNVLADQARLSDILDLTTSHVGEIAYVDPTNTSWHRSEYSNRSRINLRQLYRLPFWATAPTRSVIKP
ncbi:MAG: hypothetical protein R2787_01435 [Saprospiraceae bacterium]